MATIMTIASLMFLKKYPGAPGNKNSANLIEAKIVQGVARMDAFTRITGLPYDRVMIFPHAIGGEETLVSLRKIQFLGNH